MPERVGGWGNTGLAMVLLTGARLLVALVPLRLWRRSLGAGTGGADTGKAALLAKHVERAAARLPWATKCLPRAMALSWLLRLKGTAHTVVIAVRPPELRSGEDALHAWVEVGGACVLGALPGPWHQALRLTGRLIGEK